MTNRPGFGVADRHKLFSCLGFDTVFHSEACTFNDDSFGVVKKTIKDGGGNGAIGSCAFSSESFRRFAVWSESS
jgi:hypothetical protein